MGLHDAGIGEGLQQGARRPQMAGILQDPARLVAEPDETQDVTIAAVYRREIGTVQPFLVLRNAGIGLQRHIGKALQQQ